MAITPLHFAFITKIRSAFCSSKSTLPYGSNNSIFSKCAIRSLFSNPVTYYYALYITKPIFVTVPGKRAHVTHIMISLYRCF